MCARARARARERERERETETETETETDRQTDSQSQRESQVKSGFYVYRPVARYKGIVSSCSVLVNEENIIRSMH